MIVKPEPLVIADNHMQHQLTAKQFSSQFCLQSINNTDNASHRNFRVNSQSKVAAVLVPIVARESGLQVVLTKRASHLRHHPRQISFPGGKKDPQDPHLMATALRESHEEIGLLEHLVSPLGWLEQYQTGSNFTVHPLVAIVEPYDELTINQNEVERVFEVPLSHLLSGLGHSQLEYKFKNQIRFVHFIKCDQQIVWGATAAMLHSLRLHINQ